MDKPTFHHAKATPAMTDGAGSISLGRAATVQIIQKCGNGRDERASAITALCSPTPTEGNFLAAWSKWEATFPYQ